MIQFNGTKEDVRRIARDLAGMLSGRVADRQNIARGFLMSLGVAALDDIHAAFITKSRGGTDEMGMSWPPLSKEYLAYGRRFGPGEQSGLKRSAGLGRGHSFAPGGNRGLLTRAQQKRWNQIFASRLARFLNSMSEGEAKARAAQIAWATLKREGAKTKLEVFGNRKVDILRDTGVLLNSLGPGIPSPGGYTKPSGNGGDEQVFALRTGSVSVGTSVKYAAAHQNGNLAKGLPRRQFLPENESQVPGVWWERWLDAGVRALHASIDILWRQAA